jgi:type I restriction enzyme, S subunit
MMLPEGWAIQTLESLASVKRGKFTPRPRNDPRYYGGEMPFVQTGDVTSAGKYLTEFSQTLNEEGVGVSKVFPPNSILITIAANIGHTAITTFDVACPDSVVGIQPIADRCDVLWLKDVLETKREELDGLSTQNAQKNINLEVLKPLSIVTPPLPEQRKIAEILSTWDAAIGAQERLIANAKRQKKSLMQTLLPTNTHPPKKRLPGFSGEWTRKHFRDAVYVDRNSLGQNTPADFRFRYISLSDVETGTIASELPELEFASAPSRARRKLTTGDILMATVRPNLQAFARVGGHHADCIASTGFAVLTAKPGFDPSYIYHYLFSEHLTGQIDALVVGSSYPAINSSDIQGLSIYCSNADEQAAIAQVLNASDALITDHENQLSVFRQEKSALMQQLLTGKRRVKTEDAENV